MPGATQVQSGNTATTVDFLLERKLANAGVITLEGEFANYNSLGGYFSAYKKSSGTYGLAAYILPMNVGAGKIQLLGKFAKADFSHGTACPSFNQKTTEINVNYLLEGVQCSRAWRSTRKRDFSNTRPDAWKAGIGFQIQM